MERDAVQIVRFRVVLAVLVLVVAALLSVSVGYSAGWGRSRTYCGSCHQIRPSAESWAESVHRETTCAECHGHAIALDWRMHATNLRHVWYQVSGRVPDRVVLKDAEVDRIAGNCARCHRDKLAQWRAGGHSVGYRQVFLSAKHNERTRLMDDCLRCHGMFADGGVRSIVTPIDHKGPWRLVDDRFADRPAIPCLACHMMHSPGTPATGPDYLAPKGISYRRTSRTTSLAFYDRRERRHVPAAWLPLPAMRIGGRAVRMSPDTRQAVCYQCHAPEARHEVRSGDDRTAIGVHEGIGCLGCHDAHSLDARVSCANCHPALSNCGLDVAAMDTTFRSDKSAHNIHFVACADCHPKGVPKRRGPGGA